MEKATEEAGKDTGRIAIFAAISTVVTYGVSSFLPDLPASVMAAVVVLLLAGLTWVDSYIHNRKDVKVNGLLPF